MKVYKIKIDSKSVIKTVEFKTLIGARVCLRRWRVLNGVISLSF